MSFKPLFTRSLGAAPGRLHFAAHSHHLWPDASFEGQVQCWQDAAVRADHKWDKVMGEVWPEAQANVAAELGSGDPSAIVFASNTHDFLIRLQAANLNAYVYLLQAELGERGLYEGAANGMLGRGTIAAISSFCSETGIRDVCDRGPLTSRAARALAGALFVVPGGLGISEAGITALSRSLLDLSRSTAAAATVLIRFFTLWFGVGVGLIALLLLSRRLGEPDVSALEAPETTSV